MLVTGSVVWTCKPTLTCQAWFLSPKGTHNAAVAVVDSLQLRLAGVGFCEMCLAEEQSYQAGPCQRSCSEKPPGHRFPQMTAKSWETPRVSRAMQRLNRIVVATSPSFLDVLHNPSTLEPLSIEDWLREQRQDVLQLAL